MTSEEQRAAVLALIRFEMDKSLDGDPDKTHIRKRVEDFLIENAFWLTGELRKGTARSVFKLHMNINSTTQDLLDYYALCIKTLLPDKVFVSNVRNTDTVFSCDLSLRKPLRSDNKEA